MRHISRLAEGAVMKEGASIVSEFGGEEKFYAK